MLNIAVCGCCGKMGRVIDDIISARDDCRICFGVDICGERYGNFPVYKKFSEADETPDVIIDFSHPSLLDELLDNAMTNGTPVVIATTGYSDEQIAAINKASEQIPIFFTFNMSLGINLMEELARKAASVLGGQFDIEIIEKHHNQKLDAPSGTALMLAGALNDELGKSKTYVYDRHSVRQKRSKNEIGIHSVRGGTIVGEHEIIFAGRDEVFSLRHEAHSKQIFAVGAVNAAVFMVGKKAGMYNMKDLL